MCFAAAFLLPWVRLPQPRTAPRSWRFRQAGTLKCWRGGLILRLRSSGLVYMAEISSAAHDFSIGFLDYQKYSRRNRYFDKAVWWCRRPRIWNQTAQILPNTKTISNQGLTFYSKTPLFWNLRRNQLRSPQPISESFCIKVKTEKALFRADL